MNLLPIVIGVLLILSWGVSSIQEKHIAFRRFQKMFYSIKTAERKCHQKTQLQAFNELPGSEPPPPKPEIESESQKPRDKHTRKIPEVNPLCGRINLFPLIQDGAKVHPELEAGAKMTLKAIYGSLAPAKQLDLLFAAILKAAEKKRVAQEELTLSTLSLEDPVLQKLYYSMLKGMRSPDLFNGTRVPPLGDHFKIDLKPSHICVLHAHPHALIPFFGKKGAMQVFLHLGEKKRKVVSLEELLLAAGDSTLLIKSKEHWALLGMSHVETEPDFSETVTGDEDGISIRRPVQ